MCVEKFLVGTGQHIKRIEGFTTYKKRIGITLISVTVCAMLCHLSFQ